MNKTELFTLVLEDVARVCEVSAAEIMNGKRTQQVCDARCIVMKVCRKLGLTNADIMQITGKKNINSINSIVAYYADKLDQSFFFRQAVADAMNSIDEKLKDIEQANN